MCGNEIQHIPQHFFKTNTKLVKIDLSSNQLNSIDFSLIQNSEKFYEIYLQGNLINHVRQNFTNRLDLLSNESQLWLFDISGNPLDCSCDTGDFQRWIHTSEIVTYVRNLTCNGNADHRKGNHVLDYTVSTFYCKWWTPVLIASSALIAVILSSPLGIFIYCNRWYVSHIRVVVRAMVASAKQIKMEQECKYDAFISYNPRNDQDSLWIIEYLIPELEGKSGDQVCCLLMLSVYSIEHQSILLFKGFFTHYI